MQRRNFLTILAIATGAAALGATRAHSFAPVPAAATPDPEDARLERVTHQKAPRNRCHYYRRYGTIRRYCPR